jgi:hypothetical protein
LSYEVYHIKLCCFYLYSCLSPRLYLKLLKGRESYSFSVLPTGLPSLNPGNLTLCLALSWSLRF